MSPLRPELCWLAVAVVVVTIYAEVHVVWHAVKFCFSLASLTICINCIFSSSCYRVDVLLLEPPSAIELSCLRGFLQPFPFLPLFQLVFLSYFLQHRSDPHSLAMLVASHLPYRLLLKVNAHDTNEKSSLLLTPEYVNLFSKS